MLPFFPKRISSGASTRGKLKRGRLSICHNRGWVFYRGGGKGGEVINLSSAPEEEKHGRKEEQESRKERPFLI